MDFITLHDGSGKRICGRTVNYSAAVNTTTLHLLNQSFHLYKKAFSFPFAVNTLFIHPIPFTVPPQVAVLIYRTENGTEQRTTSTKPSNSVLFITHSVHKVNAFKHSNFSFPKRQDRP